MPEAEITIPAQATPTADAVKESAPASQAAPTEATAPSGQAAEASAEAPKASEPEAKTTETAKSVVPEKYELKLPEGSPLTPQAIEKISAFAKAAGLSNDQAQKVLENESQAVIDFTAAQKADLAAKSTAWVEELKHHPQYGGERFNESAELSKRALERFGSPAFKEALQVTGLGNHPELFDFFVKVGRELGEDKMVVPGANGQGRVDPAQVLYPNKK